VTIWVALAVIGACGAALGALAADAWHHRRQGRRERERRELEQLAGRQAIADAQAADRGWARAHRPYNASLYVHAGVLRTLGVAAHKRADAIRNLNATGQPVRPTVLSERWRPPFRLAAGCSERPESDRWPRFDRAADALAAIATTPGSQPDAVAGAHDELALAALQLAAHLEQLAPEQQQAGGATRCSFCGRSNKHPDIAKMIVGPGTNICSDCVSLCAEIIDEPDRPE
jgi:hypothetical protein